MREAERGAQTGSASGLPVCRVDREFPAPAEPSHSSYAPLEIGDVGPFFDGTATFREVLRDAPRVKMF
jgi:hypothetical protein